jgi:hypothetical protein
MAWRWIRGMPYRTFGPEMNAVVIGKRVEGFVKRKMQGNSPIPPSLRRPLRPLDMENKGIDLEH